MAKFIAATALAALLAVPAGAAVLDEATFGEFADTYSSPTDWTGYTSVQGYSSGLSDYEYFRISSFAPGTTALSFSLSNSGLGSNAFVRLSSTAFTMAEWDWTISALDAGNPDAQLYSNLFLPDDTYTYALPSAFSGPIYGFFRFYNATTPSAFTMTAVGASAGSSGSGGGSSAVVPLPAPLWLLLSALGGLAVLRRRQALAVA